MVAGGWSGLANLASTETLLAEAGTAWVEAAALPSARRGLSGQGLGDRHFIVTGEAHLYSRAVNKPSLREIFTMPGEGPYYVLEHSLF